MEVAEPRDASRCPCVAVGHRRGDLVGGSVRGRCLDQPVEDRLSHPDQHDLCLAIRHHSEDIRSLLEEPDARVSTCGGGPEEKD